MGRFRNQELKVFLSEEEMELLKEKMAQVGYGNRSQYVRKMILDGYIIQIDSEPIKALLYEINKVGVNVNQFMHVVNVRNLKGETIGQDELVILENYVKQLYEKVGAVIELMIN